MKKIILILILIPSLISAQQIVKIIKQYALIDTDQGIGEIGDRVSVYRHTSGSSEYAGRVVLLKFKDGKAACKIIEGQVRIGDVIKTADDLLLEELLGTEDNYPGIDEYSEDDRQVSTEYTENQTGLNPPEQKGKTEFGLLAGGFIPLGEMADAYTISPNIGIFVSIPVRKHYNIVFEAAYPFLLLQSEYADVFESYGVNVNATIIMVTLYDRYAISPSFLLDIGGGLYLPRISISGFGESESISETHWGLGVGPTLRIGNSASLKLYLSGKFHTYRIGDEWTKFIRMDIQIAF